METKTLKKETGQRRGRGKRRLTRFHPKNASGQRSQAISVPCIEHSTERGKNGFTILNSPGLETELWWKPIIAPGLSRGIS